jgi:hypothetical protein
LIILFPHHSLFSFSQFLLVLISQNSPHFMFMSFFFRCKFCIWEKICDIGFSDSGLFHLALWSPIPVIFIQRT